jgi:hypothetical protein
LRYVAILSFRIAFANRLVANAGQLSPRQFYLFVGIRKRILPAINSLISA